jgi:DDE superfamily endonuclease
MSALQTYSYFPELAQDEMTEFSQAVFSSLPRADQRRWAALYLRGLMCLKGKKSIRRIAEGLPYPAVQSLQQFLNQSPWDWNPVSRALAGYVAQATIPAALSVGIVHIPKRGTHSIGVRRRFVKEADRLVNAQVGVGLFLTSQGTSFPVSWRIVLDGSWGSDPELRRKVSVPWEYRIESVPEAVLDILDDSANCGEPLPVLADLRGMPSPADLAAGLSQRSREFVIEVDGTLPVSQLPHSSGARARTERPCEPLSSLCRSASHHYPVLPVPGNGGRSFPALTALVQLPDTRGPVHTLRAIAQRPTRDGNDGRYWLTNVLDQQRWADATALLLLHARHKAELREFCDSFGVGDFQGRSFVGWHHHMTLSSAAFAGSRLVCGTGGSAPHSSASDPRSHCPPERDCCVSAGRVSPY